MAVKMKIRKGDKVIVIAGRDKGRKGEVIGVFPRQGRALVSGAGMVKRHAAPSQSGPGGIMEREARIHVSNLALEDPRTGGPTRTGIKRLEDGRKVRVAKKSGETIDA